MMTASALALMTTAAVAGGIDRSGQGIGILFEKGTYGELSFGTVSPSVSGTDVALFGGGKSGNVGSNYEPISLSFKTDINEKLSFAAILDQPFSADVLYGPTSAALGGTKAVTTVTALTALLKYNVAKGVSVYGGLREQQASGVVHLSGAAYGAFNGYNVALSSDGGMGYVVGAAYEKPEIALRVALTYNSKITHEFGTLETVSGSPIGNSPTEVETPQSVNLDFQTGINKTTLVYGQIRWADWSEFDIDPKTFTTLLNGGSVKGGGLVDLKDSITYTLGVGHKFNDTWSGSASVLYEAEDSDPLVSPLAPTNGKLGVTLAAIYTKNNLKITTGVNYTKVGDAQPETGTPDVARANFTGNSAIGVGIKIGYSF